MDDGSRSIGLNIALVAAAVYPVVIPLLVGLSSQLPALAFVRHRLLRFVLAVLIAGGVESVLEGIEMMLPVDALSYVSAGNGVAGSLVIHSSVRTALWIDAAIAVTTLIASLGLMWLAARSRRRKAGVSSTGPTPPATPPASS